MLKRRQWKLQGIKYSLERMAIIIAIILWIFTALRVISNGITKEVSANDKKDMVSIFYENVQSDIYSKINVYGVITESYLSEDAKQLILENIANEIGINRYDIYFIEEKNECLLKQESVYGNVELGIITSNDKNYLVINLKLDKGVESSLQYKNIVADICKEYGIDSGVNMCLTGKKAGKISLEERNQIASDILAQLGAKTLQSRKTMDLFTIYAWDKNEENYIKLGKDKVNINVSMHYDEESDTTWIYLATPVYVED